MGKKRTIIRKRKSEAICSTSSSSSGESDTPQTPIKSTTATPSISKILRCSPRPRRSNSSSNNNSNNIEAEADDGVVLVEGQQEREAAAAAAEDPKSKKKDKKRKMQQPSASASASAAAAAAAAAAAEKSRQQQQEEEEAAAAADHPKLTKKWKMQEPASSSSAAAASEKDKSSSSTTSIWSVEDEITVLLGIIDDAKRNNGLPLHYNKKNAETFLTAIAPSLGLQPTVHQLERKIRYMKETYANAPAAKKSKATGHKKLLYGLCDKIWLSPNCYVAEAAEKVQVKDDNSKSKGDYNYPELKIAVERQGGYLVFDEVVAALGEEKARRTDEQFGMLRKKEKKHWKLIHECL